MWRGPCAPKAGALVRPRLAMHVQACALQQVWTPLCLVRVPCSGTGALFRCCGLCRRGWSAGRNHSVVWVYCWILFILIMPSCHARRSGFILWAAACSSTPGTDAGRPWLFMLQCLVWLCAPENLCAAVFIALEPAGLKDCWVRVMPCLPTPPRQNMPCGAFL